MTPWISSTPLTCTPTWGLVANIDDLLAKPARNAQPDLLELGNDYLAFIRRKPPLGSPQLLIDAYVHELRQRQQQRES